MSMMNMIYYLGLGLSPIIAYNHFPFSKESYHYSQQPSKFAQFRLVDMMVLSVKGF